MQARAVILQAVARGDWPAAPREADYKALWRQVPAGLPPWLAAVHGGLRADRLAWLFIAGYQAAQRSLFDGLDPAAWYCVAASEDRSGERPGTSLDATGALQGCKTWIAACANLDALIVTVGRRDPALLLVDRTAAGVTIEPHPAPSFLADLSQGRATFAGVLPRATLDGRAFAGFGLAEAFHLLCASCGFLTRASAEAGDASGVDAACTLADRLEAIAADPGAARPALLDCQQQLADLGARLAGGDAGEGDDHRRADWQANMRLLTMYRPMLERSPSRQFPAPR